MQQIKHDTVHVQNVSVPLHISKCHPIAPRGSNCIHTAMFLLCTCKLVSAGVASVLALCVTCTRASPRNPWQVQQVPWAHTGGPRWGPQHTAALPCQASAGVQLPVLSNEGETPLDPEGGQDDGEVT